MFNENDRLPRDYAGNKLTFEGYMKQHWRWKGMPVEILKKKEDALLEYKQYLKAVENEDREREEFRLAEEKRLDELAKIQQKKQAELEAKAKKEKEAEEEAKAKAKAEAEATMPVWRDAFRAAPNCILRSSLFGATKPGAREEMKNVDIPTSDGTIIKYSGQRLDQSDLDVWCGVVHFARGKTADADITEELQRGSGSISVSFTSNEMLDLLGLSTNGGGNHETLFGKLVRLRETTLKIDIGGDSLHVVGLIDKFKVDGKTKSEKCEYARKYTVNLDSELLLLFAPNKWSAFDWSVRRKLGKKSLALWVHGFYSTHRNPYIYGVDKVYQYCGSDAKELRQFKSELKKAIAAVCDIAGWDGFIDNNDNVHIIKSQKNTKDIPKKIGVAPTKPYYVYTNTWQISC